LRSLNWKRIPTQEWTAGATTALTALPFEWLYGVLAVAPLGLAYAGDGVRAALWGTVLSGVLGVVLRFTGGMVLGTRPSAALVLGAMVSAQMQSAASAGTPLGVGAVFDLLALTTFWAGLAQVALGGLGVGRWLKFVPYPVIAGLMSGLGLLMAGAAIKPLLGVAQDVPWAQVWGRVQGVSLLVGAVTVGLCLWRRRWLVQHPFCKFPELVFG
jgi:SulP family sulfate permease